MDLVLMRVKLLHWEDRLVGRMHSEFCGGKVSSLTSIYLGKKLPGDSPEGSQRSKLGES